MLTLPLYRDTSYRASGNIASTDLLWLLTKKGTSFTHKRVGAPVFSAEKGNLRVRSGSARLVTPVAAPC